MNDMPVAVDLLDQPISRDGMTIRLWNCLTRPDLGNFKTWREVCERTGQEILRIPGLGRESLYELKDHMRERGMALWHDKRPGLLQMMVPTVHERLTMLEARIAALEQR